MQESILEVDQLFMLDIEKLGFNSIIFEESHDMFSKTIIWLDCVKSFGLDTLQKVRRKDGNNNVTMNVKTESHTFNIVEDCLGNEFDDMIAMIGGLAQQLLEHNSNRKQCAHWTIIQETATMDANTSTYYQCGIHDYKIGQKSSKQ
jgi:hypothetical protein